MKTFLAILFVDIIGAIMGTVSNETEAVYQCHDNMTIEETAEEVKTGFETMLDKLDTFVDEEEKLDIDFDSRVTMEQTDFDEYVYHIDLSTTKTVDVEVWFIPEYSTFEVSINKDVAIDEIQRIMSGN